MRFTDLCIGCRQSTLITPPGDVIRDEKDEKYFNETRRCPRCGLYYVKKKEEPLFDNEYDDSLALKYSFNGDTIHLRVMTDFFVEDLKKLESEENKNELIEDFIKRYTFLCKYLIADLIESHLSRHEKFYNVLSHFVYFDVFNSLERILIYIPSFDVRFALDYPIDFFLDYMKKHNPNEYVDCYIELIESIGNTIHDNERFIFDFHKVLVSEDKVKELKDSFFKLSNVDKEQFESFDIAYDIIELLISE